MIGAGGHDVAGLECMDGGQPLDAARNLVRHVVGVEVLLQFAVDPQFDLQLVRIRDFIGGVPVAGLALILGIDRFMSEARALTNLIGNGVATIVVGKWGNDVDMLMLNRHLNNETLEEAEQPEIVLDKVESHMATS